MELSSLNKVTLKIPANLKDAVVKLNESGLKILCVVDKSNRLLGTISDGDIRRSLLKNIKLNETVERVLNKKPITIYEDKDFLKVHEILTKNKISGIPVIDRSNKLKDLITSLDKDSIKNFVYIFQS